MNYTTRIPVEQTVGESQSILGRAGAASVTVLYRDGQPAGLGFTLDTPAGPREYRLPVDIEAMRRLLLKQEADGAFISLRKAKGAFTSAEHAACVAWRVVKVWLEAQMTLLEARMATLDQVMLPYLLTAGPESRTLYEVFKARELGELTA